jgi:hypothetical protein
MKATKVITAGEFKSKCLVRIDEVAIRAISWRP